jgi:hypothetical protein
MAGPTGQAHVFQSLWIGSRLSPLEQLCIKSFLEHGHRFVLYAYQDVADVPRGCEVEDARAIVSEADVFYYAPGLLVGSPAGFSDQFRYEVLQARGGWWADTDVLCLRTDIADTPYVFAPEDDKFFNGAVLKAPRESEFLERALTHARMRARASGGEIGLNELGPPLVSQLVRELGLEPCAWKREDLYPLGWNQVLDFFDPAQADRIEALVASSTFVHLWTNMLRIANVLKDVRPPEGSYLDRMYAAYGIEFPAYRRYEWPEMEPQYTLLRAYWDLRQEVDLLHQERARLEQSVTIKLFRTVSDAFYTRVDRRSRLGRSVQALTRLIGRVVLRSATP